MRQNQFPRGKKYALLGVLLMLAAVIAIPLVSGDLIDTGSIDISYQYMPPPIMVNQTNASYQAATFVYNTTVENGTVYSTIQVHLNFDLSDSSSTFTTLLMNVLSVYNTGNITGYFNVSITKSAQAGADKILNSTYSDALKVYISPFYQNSTNFGSATFLGNDSVTTFPLISPLVQSPMYYIGFNYTQPPYPPPSGSNWNSIQQIVNFTFTIIS